MSNARTYGTIHSEQKPFVIQHADSTDYLLGGSLVMKNGKIDKVLFDGGYAQASAVSNTTKDKFAFNFYNQDHLGNNREVVDAKGVVQQVTNYYPFGAPYADTTAVKGANLQPYKYNGKELDRMHGLDWYDYGARWMDAVIGRWHSMDPLSEKYYNVSPYAYCANNPVNAIDPDGNKILFVNGYWASGIIGEFIDSPAPKTGYWGSGFAQEAQKFFGDYTTINTTNYIDGSSMYGGDMSGADRYNAGYQYAKNNISDITSGMQNGEAFNMVTHSEGSAYGAGVAQYLLDAGYKVNTILHLSSDEGDEFSTPKGPYTLQLSYQDDKLTGNKTIQNVDKVGEIARGDLSLQYVHGTTKNKSVFKAASDLKTVRIQNNIGMIGGRFCSWASQQGGSTPNGTNFYSINGCTLRNENGTKK